MLKIIKDWPWLGIVFSILLIGGLGWMVLANISRFNYKSRQSEPKVLLRKLLDDGQFSFRNTGSYSDIKKYFGLSSDEQSGFYRYAVVICENSIKKDPMFIERKGRQGQESWQPSLLEALNKQIAAEDCAKRRAGFAAIAVGKINKHSDAIDIWRIDEAGELKNIQPGH